MNDPTPKELAPITSMPVTWKTLNAIARTEFVPKGLRGRTDAILACMLTGRELGLGPMESLRSIDIIDGKPSPSAELLTAMVRRAGHRIRPKELSDKAATAVAERVEDGAVVESVEFTFTIDMARRAGLTNKDNWRKYPEAMLWWRAAAQLVRIAFPDVVSRVSLTADELGDDQWIPPEPGHVLGVVTDGPFDVEIVTDDGWEDGDPDIDDDGETE